MPTDTLGMPGMLRKSTAFVPRYQKFESISLQQTVRLSRDFSFLYARPAVAAGCAGPARRRPAETRRARQHHANCR